MKALPLRRGALSAYSELLSKLSPISYIFFIAWSANVHASSLSYTNDEWLKLNAYEYRHGEWHSNIRNANFFITADGKTNPEKELSAFIALAQLESHSPEQVSTLCRYPARLELLRKYVPINSICDETEFNKDVEKVKSVSVIFADGYFGNPASYYGHVLVKLNKRSELLPNDTGLLDTAINYGANIPPKENPVSYIFRGVFGSYRGAFQPNKFFLNTTQYADRENRDFWAYDLSLDPEKSKQVARRAFELQNAEFDYYFFGDNCTHRVRDLISDASGSTIADDNGIWFMPMQLLQGLGRRKASQPVGLLRNVRYLPSPRTKLLTLLKHMSAEERLALEKLLSNQSNPFSAIAPEQKKRVLIAADIHLRNLSAGEAREEQREAVATQRQKVLIALLGLRGVDVQTVSPETPPPPHESGRNGTAVTISAVENRLTGGHSEITIRPAYTDSLAPDVGKIPHSTLHMGKLEFSNKNGGFRLQEVTAIEIENLLVADVPRRFSPGSVWRFSAGFKRDGDTVSSGLKTYLAGGIGINKTIGQGSNGFIMLGVHIQEKSQIFDQVHTTLSSGLVTYLGANTKARLQYEITDLRNEGQGYSLNISTRTQISVRHDLEVSINRSDYQGQYFRVGIVRNF